MSSPIFPDSRDSHIPRPTRQAAAVLLVILLAATVLRCVQIDESLWIDELHTAWTIADGGKQLVGRAHLGNQGPAYFVLPWATSSMLGMSEWALRLPSILASLATACVLYFAVSRRTGSLVAGLFTAWLVALDRNSLFYAQEARVYAWVQLLSAAHMLVLLRVVSGGGGGARCLLIGGAALLFHLHYSAALLFPGEVAFAWASRWLTPGHSRYRIRDSLVDAASVALLCLPAAPHLSSLLGRRENWAAFVGQQPLLATASIFPLWLYMAIPAIGALLERAYYDCWRGRGGVASPTVRPYGRDDATGSRAWLPWLWTACWLVVPVLAAWWLTYTDIARVFLVRYLMASSAAPLVFAGLCLANCQSRWTQVTLATTVTLALVADAGYVEQFERDGRLIGDRRQDWRGAIELVNSQPASGSLPVFLRGGLIEARHLPQPLPRPWREYLLFPVRSLYRMRVADDELYPLPNEDWLPLRPAEREALEHAQGAWLIVNSGALTVDQILEAWLGELEATQQSWRMSVAEQRGEVSVILCVRDGP